MSRACRLVLRPVWDLVIEDTSTPQDVEAETQAGYYIPIKPAMARWQYARLNRWLHDREEWARLRYSALFSEM